MTGKFVSGFLPELTGKFVGGFLLELTRTLAARNSLRILLELTWPLAASWWPGNLLADSFWNSPVHWPLADGRKIRWQITSGTHLSIGRQLMAGKFVGGSLLELTWPLAASWWPGNLLADPFWNSGHWSREIHCGSSGTYLAISR
jgi:hypothetical protein